MAALGRPPDRRYTDAERGANRRQGLAGRSGADLWVFTYGSLMWDPALRFAELRVGRVEGYARRFCLKDTWGGRGTVEMPGLMAALDHGPGCTGLAFRIAADEVEAETEVLWRREGISSASTPVFLPVSTAHGPIKALGFVPNHASPIICADLAPDDAVRFLATGTGILGSSRAYLEGISAQFAIPGIEDAEVRALVEADRSYPDGSR